MKTRIAWIGEYDASVYYTETHDVTIHDSYVKVRELETGRVRYFPWHSIETVEQTEEPMPQGYREENKFREQPDKSPHFRGMGNQP